MFQYHHLIILNNPHFSIDQIIMIIFEIVWQPCFQKMPAAQDGTISRGFDFIQYRRKRQHIIHFYFM